MTPRTVAAGCVAIFGLLGFGLMLTPVEASARGGGFGGPRGLAGPGAFHAKPSGIHSGIHPWHAKWFHHRGPFWYGTQPGVWGTPSWYGADTSQFYVYVPLPADTPTYPVAGAAPAPRICNTQIVKVPSESGGERAITIERC